MNGLGMTGKKGEPLSRAQYHRLLSNPIYCSIIRYSGELHEGKHEPIVTKNLFDRVQAVMTRKSKPKTPQLKPYVYRGVFRCGECGCFITTETQKGHNYLRCTKRVVPCSQRCLREESATQQIVAGLAHVALPEDWADWMIEELETKQQQAIHSAEEQVAQIQRGISGIDGKLELLMTGYLDKAISLPEYQIAKNRLVEEKRSQTDQLIAMERNRSKRFEPVIRFIKASKNAGFLSKTSETESQRDFLKKTGSNHRLLNRELLWEPRGAWKTLVDIDRLARHSHAASCDAACVTGEIGHIALKRREWDSNPRHIAVNTTSNRAPSATRPSLQNLAQRPSRKLFYSMSCMCAMLWIPGACPDVLAMLSVLHDRRCNLSYLMSDSFTVPPCWADTIAASSTRWVS